jgi:hypothetical protein
VLSERVDQAALEGADVAKAIEAGRARLRKHRIGRGVMAGAAVAAIALMAPAVQHVYEGDDRGSDAAHVGKVAGTGAFAERKVTYASDSDIHYGDQTISVAPLKIHAFVQVVNGFGFVTADGEVYFADGDSVKHVGTAGAPYGRLITSDDEGSVFGWVDLSKEGEATINAYDTSTEVTKSVMGPDNRTGEFEVPKISAIDGSNVYFWDSDGAMYWDLDTSSEQLLNGDVSNDWLKAVEDGWLAFDDAPEQSDGPGVADAARGDDLVISKDPGATSPRYPAGRAEFSTDATYFANDFNDTEQILTRDGGQDVTPDHAGYVFMAVVQWVDDASFVAVGFADEEATTFDLLECSVEEGTCRTAVTDLTPQQVELPTGESIKDQ